jgi:hypothetical protein
VVGSRRPRLENVKQGIAGWDSDVGCKSFFLIKTYFGLVQWASTY